MTLQHHWWQAPTLGEFPSLPPDAIPAGGARALQNHLVHLDGKVCPRGGIGGPNAWEVGALSNPAGHIMAGMHQHLEGLVISFRVSTSSPTVDTWRVPINTPTSSGQLTQAVTGANAGSSLDLVTGNITALSAATSNDVTGYRYDHLNNSTYTNALGGPSTAIPNGVAQLTYVLKNNTVSTKLTNGPAFVQDVLVHYNRLFVAAARSPGGSNYDPSLLFFTIDGGTTGNTNVLTDWQDPITGLVNTIGVGASDDGDFIVALGRAKGHLVIFKRRSVWILYGTSVDDFTLRQLRTSVGCVDPRSVVIADEGTYFASQQGFELFDGTSFQLLSRPVSDTWLEFSNRGPAAPTVNYGYITAETLPNNYLFITLGVDGSVAFSDDGAEINWLYYIPTGAWVRVKSAITSVGLSAGQCFNRAIVSPNSTTLWGGAARFVRSDRLTFGPDATVGLRDRDASLSYIVPLSWTTGIADVGAKWEAMRFNRGSVDYRHTWDTATPPDAGAMGTAALFNDAGELIATPGTLPGYRPATAPLRVRPTFDANYEAKQGGAEMVVASNIGASSSARTGAYYLYGAGIEYETGRGRRKA